jgi:methyltransferase family protein
MADAASDFATFVLDQLPPPPRRVLEIGCGEEGGLVELLAARGYDTLGVDPHAPDGDRFLQATFQDAARTTLSPGQWDAVVAGRVLHHVNPLDESIALLASLAPLLLVDEFAPDRVVGAAQAWYEQRWREVRGAQGPKSIDECAPDRIGGAAQDWYETQHRLLLASGIDHGPASLDVWRERHPDLHAHDVLLAALRAHYEELVLEWVPYLHRWLAGPSSEALEESLIAAGAFERIGYRWAGVHRS